MNTITKSPFGTVKNLRKKLNRLPDKFTFEEALNELNKHSLSKPSEPYTRKLIRRMMLTNMIENIGSRGHGKAIYVKI